MARQSVIIHIDSTQYWTETTNKIKRLTYFIQLAIIAVDYWWFIGTPIKITERYQTTIGKTWKVFVSHKKNTIIRLV